MATDSQPLGSLSQAARAKKLGSARGILLVIGVLTVVVNGIFFTMIADQVDNEIEKQLESLRAQGMAVEQAQTDQFRNTAIRIAQLVQGAAIGLGVVFVVLGFMVYRYPVPVTVTALVLYIGAAAVFGLLDPATLLTGIIIKIIIVVALIQALKSALAYRRAEQEAVPAMAATFPEEPA